MRELTLKEYQNYINDIPNTIDSCKMCKVYNTNNGYDLGHYDENDVYVLGRCKECCWFYGSKFEVEDEQIFSLAYYTFVTYSDFVWYRCIFKVQRNRSSNADRTV